MFSFRNLNQQQNYYNDSCEKWGQINFNFESGREWISKFGRIGRRDFAWMGRKLDSGLVDSMDLGKFLKYKIYWVLKSNFF